MKTITLEDHHAYLLRRVVEHQMEAWHARVKAKESNANEVYCALYHIQKALNTAGVLTDEQIRAMEERCGRRR